MSKKERSRLVSVESKVLKILREKKKISQRQLAQLLKVSQTTVNHMENGWEEVNENYISKFLKSINYMRRDWDEVFENDKVQTEMRSICKKNIDKLNQKKLIALYQFLIHFQGRR